MTSTFRDNPASNQLQTVVRSSDSANLVVCFNGCGYKAYSRPDLSFGSNLTGRATFLKQDAHIIWFAESVGSWYLAHQESIVRTLVEYIIDNGITRVKLFGGSAGGYAAIRMGLLIDQRLSSVQNDVMLLSFSMNPQTGFRPALIQQIRQAVQDRGWNSDDVGKNPLLLSEEDYHFFSDLKVDLSELMEDLRPRNFAGVVLSDVLNPIEQTFCNDIASRDFLLIHPFHFGMPHAEGASRIYKEGGFWSIFDSIHPFGTVDPASAEQMVSFDATLPMPSILRRTMSRHEDVSSQLRG